jgi:hypothetical protein
MTGASSPAPARVHTQPALNYAAIRARAAELGMLEKTLNELTGVTLGTLERDPDQRGIGLPLLTRLATVLDLPLDDLVVTGEPAPHPGRGTTSSCWHFWPATAGWPPSACSTCSAGPTNASMRPWLPTARTSRPPRCAWPPPTTG